MYRFTGGRMLRALFPSFTKEMAISLIEILASGLDDDFDFAIKLLENYHGESPVQTVIKEMIDRLPENDTKLHRLEICLSNMGGVMGSFSMVQGYREKKEEMSLWLQDTRPKVSQFARPYILRMEQTKASEQRSSEIRTELRKRDYEVDGS